jgi:hypothetical protein
MRWAVPGANNGTGQPIAFRCWRCRRRSPAHRVWAKQYRYYHGRNVVVTGRTKDVGRASIRMDLVSREYKCDCGYVGWSRHKDLAHWIYHGNKQE